MPLTIKAPKSSCKVFLPRKRLSVVNRKWSNLSMRDTNVDDIHNRMSNRQCFEWFLVNVLAIDEMFLKSRLIVSCQVLHITIYQISYSVNAFLQCTSLLHQDSNGGQGLLSHCQNRIHIKNNSVPIQGVRAKQEWYPLSTIHLSPASRFQERPRPVIALSE